MNIDKELIVTCPEECGQIAVSCSIRMILENQFFLCESCGCEFQGTLYPAWLANATHGRFSVTEMQLFNMMKVLYAYLYAGGNCPSEAFLCELLLENPQYWQLFPVKKKPINVILKLLATDASFAQSFDCSVLPISHWLELLSREPSYASKCPWERFSRYVVDATVSIPDTFLQNKELIFSNSGLDADKKFSVKAKQENYNLTFPILFAQKLGWSNHLNWKAFKSNEIFTSFQMCPELLGHYPFTKSNVTSFDWKNYTLKDWAIGIQGLPKTSPLLKIHSLVLGKDVVKILNENPQWENYCAWDRISSKDWMNIILKSPNWVAHCPWNVFDAKEWLVIIQEKPEYASHCPWGVFNFDAWMKLFSLNIDYSQNCDWRIFSSGDWVKIVEKYPEFSKHCHWECIVSSDWKQILTDDLKDKDAYLIQNHGSGISWEKTFNYADMKHPEYLAIFNMLNAKRVCEAISNFPEYVSKYLQWDKISGEEWLSCLSKNASYASRCTCKHWSKIVEYIRLLPLEQRRSVKNFSQELWNNRITILESANCLEITHLSAEDFYTLIDFMDWEWDRHFSWKALTREQILLVAKKHPEILEKYGFEKISDKEMAQLLSASAEFMDFCLEKAKGNDDKAENIRKLLTHDTISGVLTAHPEAYPKFKSYFSLNFLDCIGFRYYGVEELRHKVAFYRLFVTQAFMFILGWWYLYYGECGYKSFRVEHPQMARMAMYGYIIYGLLWSFIQARLHEYCGKERLSRFLGIVHGCLGVMFFGYTFFLTSLTRLNYLFAIGIYSIYMFVMFFCHRHCARDLARRI